jgi:predicted DNA-binding transcriptional regulator AlpA
LIVSIVFSSFTHYLFLTQKQAMMTDLSSILLPTAEAAKLCGVSIRTWYTWDQLGKIPKPLRVGRKLFWRRDEITAWIDEHCPPRDDWDFCPKKNFRKTSQ